MSRGAHDGLLMVFTNINVLVAIVALLVLVEALCIPVSGGQMGLMSVCIAVITVIMWTTKRIDGFGALTAGFITGMLQAMFVLATVEAMMPIDIWWFYYPVAYLAIWIFEGAYLMCEWGKEDGCKE